MEHYKGFTIHCGDLFTVAGLSRAYKTLASAKNAISQTINALNKRAGILTDSTALVSQDVAVITAQRMPAQKPVIALEALKTSGINISVHPIKPRQVLKKPSISSLAAKLLSRF